MVQSGTFLKAIDNLGIKELKSIRVLGGIQKKAGKLGDFVTISIKEVRTKKLKTSSLKKGDLGLALIAQTRSIFNRLDGQKINFLKNSAFMLDKQEKPLGSRLGGLICKEFRKKKGFKFANLITQVV